MSQGAIATFSVEIVEWKIPDILRKDVMGSCVCVESTRFSLADSTWYLRVYRNNWDVYLNMDDSETATKKVNYAIGVKTASGLVVEKGSELRTFSKSDLYGHKMIKLWNKDIPKKELEELVPSGLLTVTCRIELIQCETPTPREVAPKYDPPELRPRLRLMTPKQVVPKYVTPELRPQLKKSEEVRSQRMILVDLETLSSDLSDLLSDDRKYDVTIDVQGKEFRSHRTVLSARSPVFRAMYEHDTAEAKSGFLTIPDCDPDSFRDFLRYLYTGRIEEVSFETAYHLYATAEKYDVKLLKSFCADYLRQNLNTENVCDAVILADKYGDDPLMFSAQGFFNVNSYKIFLSSGWNAMLLNTPRLTKKLLTEMATAALKSS